MLGAIMGGLASSILPSLVGAGESALRYKGQKSTNRANERIARDNRDFQERMSHTAMDYQTDTIDKAHNYQTQMSNSAYQRSMADMKSAGLNPILAYQQGGASTPIGQTAPGHSAAGSVATMQNPFGGLGGSAIQNASTVADTVANVKLKGQQKDTLYWEARKHASQTGLNQVQSDKVAEEIAKIGEEIKQVRANTTGIEADNVQRQILADFYESAEFARIAKSIGITPSTFGGIIRTFFGKKGKK